MQGFRVVTSGFYTDGFGNARCIDADAVLRSMWDLDPEHTTSMQRDIAAGLEPELDAVPGAVLRRAARHDLQCPTIERLVATIRERIA